MKFHVLTLFPEMIENGLHTSITGRAMEKGIISLNTVNIRDFAGNKHGKVDDYPYGGGAGMVMQAEPVYSAHRSIEEQAGRKIRTIYLTPQGKTLRVHRRLCADRRRTARHGHDRYHFPACGGGIK